MKDRDDRNSLSHVSRWESREPRILKQRDVEEVRPVELEALQTGQLIGRAGNVELAGRTD